MSNIDFQNGFALGMMSKGYISSGEDYTMAYTLLSKETPQQDIENGLFNLADTLIGGNIK